MVPPLLPLAANNLPPATKPVHMQLSLNRQQSLGVVGLPSAGRDICDSPVMVREHPHSYTLPYRHPLDHPRLGNPCYALSGKPCPIAYPSKWYHSVEDVRASWCLDAFSPSKLPIFFQSFVFPLLFLVPSFVGFLTLTAALKPRPSTPPYFG